MTETGQKFLLFVLIGLMALPSGLCSAVFTVGGLGMLLDRDPVAQAVSGISLVGAAIGWIFCALVLIGARRLRRMPPTPTGSDQSPKPTDSPPP
ncbi:phage holin family protein [Rhodoplanes sp. SY1]|uniref:phage holin family protein n=1 Tax=Rhodoplanes sp. SY1 TaxID=3166646 RepID=UPI0038B5F010